MTSLASQLLAAQKAMPAIHKDSKATVPTKKGGTFSYTYLSLATLLETVLPVLNEHGLALSQMPSFEDGRHTLTTTLFHGESGETLIGETPLVLSGEMTPQTWGGAITYARRYALTALLGIAADEDDDGAAASKPQQAKKPAQISQQPEKTGSDDKPNQDQLTVIDRLITELAALRGVERGTVIKSLDEKPMTEQWRTSETSAVFAIDRLRSWAKQAAAEAGVVAS